MHVQDKTHFACHFEGFIDEFPSIMMDRWRAPADGDCRDMFDLNLAMIFLNTVCPAGGSGGDASDNGKGASRGGASSGGDGASGDSAGSSNAVGSSGIACSSGFSSSSSSGGGNSARGLPAELGLEAARDAGLARAHIAPFA